MKFQIYANLLYAFFFLILLICRITFLSLESYGSYKYVLSSFFYNSHNTILLVGDRRSGMERECGSKKTLFSEEELQEISGVIVGDDYVEVMCGCTSHRYGDAIARLRVFLDGDLQITCQCTPACHEDKLSPAAFEKHSERETSRNWRNNVWVFIKGDKVPLSKTVLLRYYNKTLKTNSNGSKVIHRDEFVGCSRCGKERRFRLRSRGECRKHHDALAEPNWKCCDYQYHKITCDEEEERVSRKVYRGCTRSPSCKGCTSCVCFGCNLCRFSDCSCQTCLDFTTNTKPI